MPRPIWAVDSALHSTFHTILLWHDNVKFSNSSLTPNLGSGFWPKISKQWDYLLQEVAILQIIWWLVKSEWTLSAKGLCPSRGWNPHPLDYWGECFTDWATAALIYGMVKLHQLTFNACGLKKVTSAASIMHMLDVHMWTIYTIGTICLYLLQFHQPSKNLQNGWLPVIGNLIFYRF